MEKWDNREKNQPLTEIDFRGKCYHSMKKEICIYCSKTMRQITERRNG